MPGRGIRRYNLQQGGTGGVKRGERSRYLFTERVTVLAYAVIVEGGGERVVFGKGTRRLGRERNVSELVEFGRLFMMCQFDRLHQLS